MQLLLRPKPFTDESLESYLLRLAEANFLESYRLLSDALRDWLWKHDHEAAGAFPVELSRINIYHAKQHSGLRVRALKLVEKLTDGQELPLLKLALLHSSAQFCNGYKAVFRDGVDIPRRFLRRGGVPVCPKCLSDLPYIRQHWHWNTYQVCTVHECELLHRCPSCGRQTNYLQHEIITRCPCGYDLTKGAVRPAAETQFLLSQVVIGKVFDSKNPLLGTSSLSVRNGALLWFALHTHAIKNDTEAGDLSGLENAVGYFESWPSSYISELADIAENADQFLLKDFNKTAFSQVFESTVVSSRWLPVSDTSRNFILATVIGFLTELVDRNPRGKRPNVADLLLTMPEAAALLSSTQEQIYRLYEEGYLELGYRPPMHQKIPPNQPAFYLRQVIELRQARMPSEGQAANLFLSKW